MDEKTKKELLDSTPEWLRDARSKGEPTMGSGNIYPIPWRDIEVQPFQIPSSWKRGYGLDVGWNRTAAVWGAQDAIEGTIYLYAEHYLGREKPVVHAASIKERGAWQKGAIDPASRGSSQDEGKKLIDLYKSEGLNLINANNRIKSTDSPSAAFEKIWQMLSMRRIRVFSTLQNFHQEYRVYRRDEHGKVVKKDDHLMDAFRYLIMTWDLIAGLPPAGTQLGAWGSGGTLDSIAGM